MVVVGNKQYQKIRLIHPTYPIIYYPFILTFYITIYFPLLFISIYAFMYAMELPKKS